MTSRKLRSGLAVLAVSALSALSAGQALAQDNGPVGHPNDGCPVEDENGGVTYVPIGTHIGPFYCGHDGDWHASVRTTGGKTKFSHAAVSTARVSAYAR